MIQKSNSILKALKVFLFITMVLPLACKKPANPGPNEVFMENKTFIPTQLNIKAGTTVTWTNKEAVLHTVTSDNSLFNSNKLDKDNTFQYTFPTAGVYYYHSNTDQSMTGAIVVQ